RRAAWLRRRDAVDRAGERLSPAGRQVPRVFVRLELRFGLLVATRRRGQSPVVRRSGTPRTFRSVEQGEDCDLLPRTVRPPLAAMGPPFCGVCTRGAADKVAAGRRGGEEVKKKPSAVFRELWNKGVEIRIDEFPLIAKMWQMALRKRGGAVHVGRGTIPE